MLCRVVWIHRGGVLRVVRTEMSAPATVSVREFARLDGCDEKLVRRAIKSGKLPTSEDGRLDPKLAGTGWRKSNRRVADSADTSKNVRTSVRTRSEARRVGNECVSTGRSRWSD